MSLDVLFEKIGATFVVTFNRPDKGNAFTGSMAKAIYERMRTVSEDRSIRAVLFRGNGLDFMNGHDLSLFNADMNAIQDQVLQKVQFFYTLIREMQTMEKPIISAVHGRVSGAGFNFALASDLVIAADNSLFKAGFTNHAMVPDGGATFFLPRKVGTARASRILMLNEEFSAADAEQWGLVSRILPSESFEADALDWTNQIATEATRALGATKRLIIRTFEQDLNAHLSLEATFWNNGCKTFDFREAMKAAAALRPAKFTGS